MPQHNPLLLASAQFYVILVPEGETPAEALFPGGCFDATQEIEDMARAVLIDDPDSITFKGWHEDFETEKSLNKSAAKIFYLHQVDAHHTGNGKGGGHGRLLVHMSMQELAKRHDVIILLKPFPMQWDHTRDNSAESDTSPAAKRLRTDTNLEHERQGPAEPALSSTKHSRDCTFDDAAFTVDRLKLISVWESMGFRRVKDSEWWGRAQAFVHPSPT